MPQLRLALAQVDAVLGDLAGNARTVREWTARAADEGAHVVAFPEMALTGYPVEDLALRASFVSAGRETMSRLATDLAHAGLGDLLVVCGYLDRDESGVDRVGRPKGSPLDAAAIVHQGRVLMRSAKH